MSFRRRRVPVACTLCRRRKRRCDAQKPTCGSCQELEADCVYENLPFESVQPQDDVDIVGSLHRIEMLLQENQAAMHSVLRNSETSPPGLPDGNEIAMSAQDGTINFGLSPNTPASNQSHYTERITKEAFNASSHDQLSSPLTIPDKHSTSSNSLLSSEVMRDMLGHYPDDYFYRLEAYTNLPVDLSFPVLREPTDIPTVDLSPSTTDLLVTSFFANIHCHYPLLNTGRFHSAYSHAKESSYQQSPESSLCYIVFALGCIGHAEMSSQDNVLPGSSYIQLVMPSLLLSAAWEFTQDVVTLQCLILANIYFACIARPLHSWKLVSMAATMVHLRLSKFENDKVDNISKEELIRTYWNCFMVECDRLAELDVPQSGLQNIVDTMPLPSFCGGFDDAETTYYLAEISIRRLLNRVHNSIYLRSPVVDNESAAPRTTEQLNRLMVICQELHRQLDAWFASIPEPYRPSLQATLIPKHDRERILGIRYLATLHIIYRPFVLHVIASERHHRPVGDNDGSTTTNIILDKCRICIATCRRYLHHAGEMLGKLSPYVWTFSISSLGAALVLNMAAQSPQLRPWVPDIDELQQMVIRNIERSAALINSSDQTGGRVGTESSLEAAVEILKEVRRKSRIRKLVQ